MKCRILHRWSATHKPCDILCASFTGSPSTEFFLFPTTVAHIGSMAVAWLAEATRASVAGCTSQGVFLHLPAGHIAFLSFQPHRGPLTLNLQGNRFPFTGLRPGSPVTFTGEQIHFAQGGPSISRAEAISWSAPDIAGPAKAGYPQRFIAALRHYHGQRPGGLPAACLAGEELRPGGNGNGPGLAPLVEALKGRRAEGIAAAIEAFYGFGEGLTPSGDDLILGLLLALNRWGKGLGPELELSLLNRLILARAYHKTTTLSASLIECATQGQADERLIFALDQLATGKSPPEECATLLLSWGHASGGDALTGMALAMRSLEAR